ncbi:MAG TPA: hypothetical protein VF234_01700 [Limnochordia bacterium]
MKHPSRRRAIARRLLAAAILLAGVAGAALSPAAAASTGPVAIGARALGMGGAYTAVAEGLEGLYWNPAGLAGGRFDLYGTLAGGPNLDLVTQLQKATADPEQFAQDFALSEGDQSSTLEVGTLVGLKALSYAIGGYGQFAGELTKTGSLSVSGKTDVTLTARWIATTAAAGAWSVRAPLGLGSASVGVAVKRLEVSDVLFSQQYKAGAPPTVDERQRDLAGNGVGIDLGVRASLTPWVTVGAVVRNAGGVRVEWSGTDSTVTKDATSGAELSETTHSLPDPELLPAEFRVGAALRPPVLGAVIAADVTGDGSLYVGVEKRFLFDLVALRLGRAMPKDGPASTTFGMGFGLGPVRFNAGLATTPTDDGGSHTYTALELGVRF